MPPTLSHGGHDATIVERVLGGSWVPALWTAIPTLLVAAGLAAVTAVSQLFVSAGSNIGTLFIAAPNTTSGYFHAVSQQIAMALGSPLFSNGGSTNASLGHSPLLVTVAIIAAFGLLLRRAVWSLDGGERAIVAVRSTIVTVLLLVAATFGGSVTTSVFGEREELSVSPGRVFGWATLILGIVAFVVAARPLHWLAARYRRVDLGAGRAVWEGTLAATATAVTLGFVVAVVAAFTETTAKAGEIARMTPDALGHAVDLGVNGWQFAMGGTIRSTLNGAHEEHLSLLHRHGVSAFYWVMVLIPVAATLAGALAIGRHRGTLDERTLSRCCYRMALPISFAFILLAIPSTEHFTSGRSYEGHLGPQVLLGALIAIAWFGVLGFGLGQLLYRGGAQVADQGYRRAVPVPFGARVSPIVIGVVAAVLLVGGGIAAAVTHGGKDADLVQPQLADGGLGDTSTDDSSDTANSASSSDSRAEDAEAKATLRELSIAEETYMVDYGTYTSSTSDLSDYSEPSSVYVSIANASSDSYCATASGLSSSNTFTYDSSAGGLSDGDNC